MKAFTEEGVGGAGGAGGAGEAGAGGAGALGELVIAEPAEFRNKTFSEHLRQLPWHEKLLTRSLEHSLIHGPHMVFCRLPDDLLAIPAAVYQFPNISEADGAEGAARGGACGAAPASSDAADADASAGAALAGGASPALARLPAALALALALAYAVALAARAA
ncbi:hypothetical protein R5R35_003495 [Gryllus longicercus]|uniref:Uncharacterized protein n=1 Tax=Gryllus longicercus TaxID=2509291 RepID=A0AAN9ZDA1_9ORTH